jgi:hypothetical protein
MLRENPMMKRVFALGEAQVGKLVQQLASNEKFVATVQKIVAQSFKMKGTLDRNLQTALSAMNLPSMADVKSLKDTLEKMEASVEKLTAKVDGMAASERNAKGQARA